MRYLIFQFIAFYILSSCTFAQTLTNSNAHIFITALINDSPDLENFVLESELNLSKRLGITYPDAKHKFLISNDVDTKIKEEIKNGNLNYKIDIDSIDTEYSILKFEVPARQIKNEYYFYRYKLISKPYYFAKDWEIEKSKYFIFHINDPSLFNKYSQNQLDNFVDQILVQLDVDESEKTKLQKEKIHYFLCKDENEIELLTNYKARGLYFIPYDYIISTFSCHHHELVHLLVNYKSKSINLYTLPLLQEGLAVAFGGRGGKEPNVILNMGLFLAQSNFVDYRSMLSKNDFYQFDPSMTYPVAGLYTKFLITEIGIEKYLELYKKNSADFSKINLLTIDDTDLPSETAWQSFLAKPEIENPICVSGFSEGDFKKIIIDAENFKIFENDKDYLIKLKSDVSINSNQHFESYTSKLFIELFPNKNYKNEKYIITADADEVSIYNFYSNNLIAKYVKGFSSSNAPVINKDGFFIFTISKNVFDEEIRSENFSISNI
jgi:hypothetical protein